jgi:hypothetical protein
MQGWYSLLWAEHLWVRMQLRCSPPKIPCSAPAIGPGNCAWRARIHGNIELVPGRHIVAALQAAHPKEDIDDKSIGVFYHSKLYRGRFVYMVHAKSAVLQEMVASTLSGHEIPMVSPKLYKAPKEMADIENGTKAFKDEMATIVGAKLSTNDRRSLTARRYWSTHKDFLTSIADDEVMGEHSLTDWAAASPAKNEQRQLNRTAAKTKCVLEQAALLKASRAVVDYVGNTEMPKWSGGNKESVEHVRYEAPTPAKDPSAEKLVYPEETLTPERERPTPEKLMSRLGWRQKLKASQRRALRWLWRWKKRVRILNWSQCDVEDNAVYAQQHGANMDVSGPDKLKMGSSRC